MKIVKKGSGAKSWSKKVTCTGKGNHGGGCGAKLLIERTDLFHTYHSSYDGDTETYTTFECPECKVLTDIDEYCVPDGRNLPSYQSWKKTRGRDGDDRVKRMIVAIGILKAVVSGDRYAMVTVEEKYRPAHDALGGRPIDIISKKLVELALDVLCGEQPIDASNATLSGTGN